MDFNGLGLWSQPWNPSCDLWSFVSEILLLFSTFIRFDIGLVYKVLGIPSVGWVTSLLFLSIDFCNPKTNTIANVSSFVCIWIAHKFQA